MDNALVLVRHGESEWNKLNLFTGWRDPDLTEKGVEEAKHAGQLLRLQGLKFDIAFTSALKRAQNTLLLILDEVGQSGLETIRDAALNERDYGDLSGLNKEEARTRWGEERVLLWRRSYDTPPPGGESLKDTEKRVVPYYRSKILPQMRLGKTVIVAAHGNSLRALIKHLEVLTGEEIVRRELATGAPIVYRLTLHGHALERRELISNKPWATEPIVAGEGE